MAPEEQKMTGNSPLDSYRMSSSLLLVEVLQRELDAVEKNMEEFIRDFSKESWTICRIFKRNVTFKKYTQQVKWKEANGIGMQNSADSSSKTSSLDSEAGEEHRCLHGGCCFKQEDQSYMNGYIEENGQLYTAGQWNSEVQTNSISLQSNLVNLNQNEIFREGNWDEIGRMVDYMMEPVTTYDYIFLKQL